MKEPMEEWKAFQTSEPAEGFEGRVFGRIEARARSRKKAIAAGAGIAVFSLLLFMFSTHIDSRPAGISEVHSTDENLEMDLAEMWADEEPDLDGQSRLLDEMLEEDSVSQTI